MNSNAKVRTTDANLRFSGHETFACRYAWLPKAYRGLNIDAELFTNEETAMVELGLGKNMVRSLRFWTEVMGIATSDKRRGMSITDFGQAVLGKRGLDPYLEDQRTLWLLHWNLSSRSDSPVFAWRVMLNHWPYPEFTRAEVLEHFKRDSLRLGYSHSAVTLAQHLDVFVHSYHSSRGDRTGAEDSLDAVLVGLDLLQIVGERRGRSERWEMVYSFRREPKPEITPELFDYCLTDFWNRFRATERTLTLREVATSECSPGQVFKLPEDDIRARLEEYARRDCTRPFHYQPSAVQGLVSRRKGTDVVSLKSIYARELVNA